jgi:hypothetical protein
MRLELQINPPAQVSGARKHRVLGAVAVVLVVVVQLADKDACVFFLQRPADRYDLRTRQKSF